MIAENLAERIRSQLADAISIEKEGKSSIAIGMPFVFDDGDPCGFRLVRARKGGGWVLDDEGGTIRRSAYRGPDLLTSGHVERLNQITAFYGLHQHDGVLTMSVEGDEVADSIYSFTQACLEIINLSKLPKERPATERTDFQEKLKSIVESNVSGSWTRNYHHPEYDPEKVYQVDYLVKGHSKDWLVFGVPTPLTAHLATIACHHYKSAGLPFGSVAIYDNEDKLKVRETIPLNEVVDKRFPRIREKRAIRDFLRSA